MRKPLGLYIHWPFCVSKCPYCDFNSHVMDDVPYERFFAAYHQELRQFESYLADKTITTIFFGGGTPSLMPATHLGRLLDIIHARCDVASDVEITLEANPTTIEADSFPAFHAAGINRVSIGIQSLREEGLRFLGRAHNLDQAKRALASACDIFERVSFDLITTKPGQTLEDWRAELQEALSYGTSHLSLYQLTIEKGTPFYVEEREGRLVMPPEDLSLALFNTTQEVMEQAGMPGYEISNHAFSGQECQHNLVYWRYGQYLGLGPGAHSRIVEDATSPHRRTAIMMTHAPLSWLQQVESKGHGIQSSLELTSQELLEEVTLMGLRLREGLSKTRLEQHTGLQILDAYKPEMLEQLKTMRLLEEDDAFLKTTPSGRLLLNQLIGSLLTRH